MYSRNLSNPPEKIIHKKKAEFGSYNGVSPRIDIRGMKAPYAGVPVPSFLSGLRIKSKLNFAFSIENLIDQNARNALLQDFVTGNLQIFINCQIYIVACFWLNSRRVIDF